MSHDLVEFDDFNTINTINTINEKNGHYDEENGLIDIIFDGYEFDKDFLDNCNDKKERFDENITKSYLTDDNTSILERAKQLLNKIKCDNNQLTNNMYDYSKGDIGSTGTFGYMYMYSN